MSDQPSPHDALFRRVLGEPANAASQLRAVLPATLVARLELEKLALVSGSFVDEELRSRYSDLLFSAPLDGHDAFVYVLVEHQSRTDPVMPFRMLEYVVRIWRRHLQQRRDGAAPRLPVVIPLVVHQNRRPWTGPTEVSELIDLPPGNSEAMGDFLPRFQFLLDDLARVDEQALRARPLTPLARMALVLLKIATGNQRLAEDLAGWVDDLHAVLERPGGVEDFIALVTYIENVGEAPADELHDLFARLGPQAKEAYVTTADMLRAEGRVEGRVEGRADVLVRLLITKFGPLTQDILDTVHAADAEQIETWAVRVLTAATLDEVLA